MRDPIFTSDKITVYHYGYKIAKMNMTYIQVKFVLELERYIFVFCGNRDLCYKNLCYNKMTQSICYFVGFKNCFMAIHDSYLYKIYQLTDSHNDYYVRHLPKDTYTSNGHDIQYNTIVDLIKKCTGLHVVNPDAITYPTVLYDYLRPSYTIKRNAYCDLLVTCSYE